ncbi:MAG: cellobiose phosphorylase [Chloroflexi bacterium]|nr:cellobiose phosphorylase [Chloroflexota bacterium]
MTKPYTISNYNQEKPFSSFLPGVAGHLGVPMWVFYVNRGQAITSFGVESKDTPIMEFQSANKAYQRTAMEGFRTFIKWKKGAEEGYYEAFSISAQAEMQVSMSELTLTDENPALGLKTDVLYFTLSGESFAALARQVTFTNTSEAPVELEILDGMPVLTPYGVDNGGLKMIGRTTEAWMQVFYLESGLPFFRLGATPGDSAEVHEIQAGHFALGFTARNDEAAPLPIFVDPKIVFGANTSLTAPDSFINQNLAALETAPQITVGKTPCAFFGQNASLAPGEEITLYTLFGHVNGHENIADARHRLSSPAYFAEKRAENQALIQTLTDTVDTQTGNARFDAYVRQTFLDNVLRGGFPIMLGNEENPHPYYIYSRKHGDPERDYNHFFLAAEFYSQGNGNFRDVCQNRRSDVLLEPSLGDHNIRTFLSLIQLDGYNPLVIRGISFSLNPEQQAALAGLTNAPQKLLPLIEERFTPGALLKYIADHHIGLSLSYDEFIEEALRNATPHLEADYGEGFWVDHWTYILDLFENYLALYPDKKADLFFGDAKIPFYRSPAQVRPRAERYVLTERGARQYDAVNHVGEAGWERDAQGEIYQTTIFGKLLLLAAIKFGTRDPEGMGIEMEAGKPGWYDALNGLPGIFGSSMNESYELLRLIRFLRGNLLLSPSGEGWDGGGGIALPVEFGHYLRDLATLSGSGASRFDWWEQANVLRESYRERTYQSSLSGVEMAISNLEVDDILNTFERCLEEGIARAQELAVDNVPPTYFRYAVTDYETLNESARPNIRAKAFHPIALPPFLEGAVRAMKVDEDAGKIYAAVQKSDLYDRALKMYKVNAPLTDEPHEIGRARAFTPGWLENESIWLHMEYKYLLGVLKRDLYEEFFDDFKNALIAFQPPERYGRSPLENSSFIVSSAHPDKSLHGNGFVARLSGATAEFMEMWTIMMAGKAPFMMQNGELVLRLRPTLPAWLFDESDQVKFNFLGTLPVTYYNPKRVNTWEAAPQKIVLELPEKSLEFDGAIPAPYAEMVRERRVQSIEIILG